MPDRIGQRLGNYRLLHLLGQGGFAEVYLGEHVYLKRRAALKLLHARLSDQEAERFLAEGQLLARLTHPNIVHILEFAVEKGMPFLAMDYAPRGTLRQHHPRGSCLSLQTTVVYVKQVAAALQYAHNYQIIHRSVKPSNMLLNERSDVLLSDFFLAVLSPSSGLLGTQMMAGTPLYMAPEQIRGKPSFASDQYSLAVVVYEWLCGIHLFEGSVMKIFEQHISASPPSLCGKNSSVPQAVEDVVLKALAKEPQERYASVQLFAEALEQASGVSKLDLLTDTQITGRLDPIFPASFATSKRVFLSASQDDDAFVARLRADVQKRGIAVWNDDADRPPIKLEQEEGARQAIRAVDVVLVIASPYTRSSRAITEHLRIASTYQRRLVFVWIAGDDITAVLPQEWGKTVQIDLIDAREERYEPALDMLVASFAEESGVVEPAGAESAFEPDNPHKGLGAVTQDETPDFS